MPTRLTATFRVLSALTLLEGLVGLYGIGVPLLIEQFMIHPYVPTLVLYLMASVNVAFNVMLFVAGTLLWRLKRRGLFLLAWTLIAEVIYFVGIATLGMHMYRKGDPASTELSNSLAAMMGVGNGGLGFQVITGFSVIAGIMIFFAYRHVGIPARPLK